MKSNIKARRLFLKIARAFYEQKLVHKEKLKKIDFIEQELVIAEKLLDSLAEQKAVDVHVLIKINTKIEKLREKIHFLQGKKSKEEIIFL